MKGEEEEEECNERTFSVRNLVATNRARAIRHVDYNITSVYFFLRRYREGRKAQLDRLFV